MISRLHQRLGTAGFVLSIIALVAALSGGAIAAKGGLTSQQKKEVKNIAKKYAGKPGANGVNGVNGAPGAKGDAGAPGGQGIQGPPGDSVSGAPITAGGACGAQTGVKYTLKTTSTNICNGAPGATGYTPTLPPGETETGVFTLSGINGGTSSLSELLALSYNIPLAAGSEPTVNVIGKDGTTAVTGDKANCDGSNGEPKADPGNLCMYMDPVFTEKLEFAFAFKSGATGAIVNLTVGKEGGSALGTWAVTAPTS